MAPVACFPSPPPRHGQPMGAAEGRRGGGDAFGPRRSRALSLPGCGRPSSAWRGGSVPRIGARLLNGAAGPSAGTVRAVAKGEAEQKAWSRMFVELNELLNASPEKPEQGKLTLLRDTKTDGSFLVHHFLSFYLKAGCKVCFVALLQSFSHYNIIAQKLGVSLTAAKERGQLVFLEGLKSCFDVLFGEEQHVGQTNPLRFISEDGSNLKTMYEFVRTSLMASGSDSWKCPVLLVDDLSVLLSLGVRPVDVLDFIHYCRVAVCSQLKGNIVVLVHSNDDSEDEENELVVNSLCHQSNLILWAEGLATGFCKDVHGQLKIIQKGSSELKAERNLLRIYQYKIQDKNVTFFARGMSAAVL